MASVNQVYMALKDLVNKDQRGFVTPATFNNFAQIAQLNIYNQLFTELELAKRARLRNTDPKGHASRIKQIEEDLSRFSKTGTISQVDGVFAKPDDLSKIIAATTFGSIILGQSTRVNIPLVYDESKIDYILLSDLSRPTDTAPVGLVSNDIEVFPSSIKKIRLTYYKYPEGLVPSTGARTASTPRFGYTTVAGKEVYSATNSIDFELPDHYFAELVIEIAKLIGINLRDVDVYNFSKGEEAKSLQ